MSKEIDTNNTFFDDIDMGIFNGDFMSSDDMSIVKDKDDKSTKDVKPDDDKSTDDTDDDTKVKDLRSNNDDDTSDTDDVDADDDQDTDDDADQDSDDTDDDNANDTDDTDDNDDDSDDMSEAEGAVVDYIKEKLKDTVTFGEEDSPTNIEELVTFFEETAEAMAMPKYPSEEMEELHNFVENGGQLQDYFDTKYGEVDLDNVDLDKESNQKSVVREYLKTKGYNDKVIKRKLDRFEDAGLLADEAEDALEELKEIKDNDAKTLLKQQEDAKRQALEHQQTLLSDVKSNVDNIDNIRGISVSKKEKDKLMEYIFKPDSNGQTQYAKDYQKDYHANLIESAYFTMNKDSFVKKVQKNVSTNVKKDMYNKIRNTGGRKIKGNSKKAAIRNNDLSAFNSVFGTFGHPTKS